MWSFKRLGFRTERAPPLWDVQYLYQYEDITPHTSVRMRKNAEAEGKQTNATKHSARVHERTHSAGQDVLTVFIILAI